MSNTRWEYKVIPVTDIADKRVVWRQKLFAPISAGKLDYGPFEKWLNEMGQQGWELVESNPTLVVTLIKTPLTYLVFKRVLA